MDHSHVPDELFTPSLGVSADQIGQDAVVDVFRAVALVTATLTTGLMAGVFYLYAVAIMPGLGRAGDRTFVGAFQSVDRAIINPLFLSTFFGPLLFTGLAAALHVPSEGRQVLPWTLAALCLYLATVLITIAVHVPLNDQIKAAGDPDGIPDLAAVRGRMEATWVRWNAVRTSLTLLALGCLAWALVEFGRL